MKMMHIESPSEKSQICEKILRALPDWFGIEEAIVDYVNDVQTMETWAAIDGDTTIGFISINKHNKATAEVHVMGVLTTHHRRGVGRLLLLEAERHLREAGYKFLEVKTLSESRPNSEYDRTRQFYLSYGFHPLEEFKTLWGEHNPCLQMIKSIAPPVGLHHVEIYVSNLARSSEFWSWLLCEWLGYQQFQKWEQGVSYIRENTYIVLVQAEDRFLKNSYHRCNIGLNHLAFHGTSKDQIDRLFVELKKKGLTILYEDRHPHAGGAESYAAFFEDPDRIKVEVVAP